MPTNRGTSAKSPEKPHPNTPSLYPFLLWPTCSCGNTQGYLHMTTVCLCVFLALSFSFALGVCTHPTPPTSVSNGPSCDVFPAFLRHKFSSLHFFYSCCCCCFCLVHIDLFIILRTLISLGKSPSLLNTLLLSLLLLVLMLMLLVCLVLLLLLVLCYVYANTASVTASARFKPEPRTGRASKQNMPKMPKRSRKNEQPVKL